MAYVSEPPPASPSRSVQTGDLALLAFVVALLGGLLLSIVHTSGGQALVEQSKAAAQEGRAAAGERQALPMP